VNDLSALSKTGNVDRAGTLIAGQKNDVAIAGGQILGDEWSDHVVKVEGTFCSESVIVSSIDSQNRSGIILREGCVRDSLFIFINDECFVLCDILVPFSNPISGSANHIMSSRVFEGRSTGGIFPEQRSTRLVNQQCVAGFESAYVTTLISQINL
jgi:hypothetical protein